MNNRAKDLEEDNASDPKQSASKDLDQGEAGRVSSSESVANQETGPRLVDIHPSSDPKSSSDTLERRSSSTVSSVGLGSAGIKTSAGSGKRPQDGALPPRRPKKDRSNLRKGKWTVREEQKDFVPKIHID